MEKEGSLRRPRPLSIEEAALFHGHLGPFLALGYRAGKEALETLNSNNFDNLKAIVYCPLKVPYSCFIDGVQCSALGFTVERGTLSF